MSTYPNQIDTDATLLRIDDGITPVTGEVINDIRDATLAIEQTLGVNPQGTAISLGARLSVSLDANGNLKASALASQGLVTLPITNAQISPTAAIQESKLDLTYTTAYLYSLISTNATNISGLGTAITNAGSNLSRHAAGTILRHDGYSIDLTSPIDGYATVEAALNAVNNTLQAHIVDAYGAHKASAISVVDSFNTINATNVQSALQQLDGNLGGLLIENQSTLHTNGIITDGYSILRQGTDTSSTLLSTVFQTSGGYPNILQVLPPNAARISSFGLNVRALTAGAPNLQILAGDMPSAITINLSSLVGPNLTASSLATYINQQLNGAHYPISAYVNGGEIVLGHHLTGINHTITIQNTGVSGSAASILGFGSIADQIIGPSTTHGALIDGYVIQSLNVIFDGYVTLGSTSATIPLGFSLPNQSGSGGILVHIQNHTTSTANGTYYIVSFPTSTSITLNTTIAAGTFEVTILNDSVGFNTTTATNGQVWDIFLTNVGDGYGSVIGSQRVSYGVNPGSGLVLSSINEQFPVYSSGFTWGVINTNQLVFIDTANSITGPIQVIPTGFLGELEVLSSDGIGKATVEVTANPTNLTYSLTTYPFAAAHNNLYLSSVHFGGVTGTTTLGYVQDKRIIGSTVTNITNNKLNELELPTYTSDLRNNGVVYGFNILSNTTTTITINGGRAYVSGKKVDVPTQTITVNSFPTDTNLITLDEFGNYSITNSSNPGYSLSNLIVGDAYGDILGVTPIAQFNTVPNQITNGTFVDCRFFIDKLDKKVYYHSIAINNLQNSVNSGSRDCVFNFQGRATNNATSDAYFTTIPAGGTHYNYILMPWSGSFAALSLVGLNFDITGGSITLQAIKNGAFFGPSLTLTSASSKGYIVFPANTYSFNAGDELYLVYTSSSLTTSTSSYDFNVSGFVYYN